MGEDKILSADELRELVMGFGPRAETVATILRSHEALRARLVEVEQHLTEVERERTKWYVKATAQMELAQAAEDRLVEVERALRVEPYDANDRPEWVHDCDLAVVEAWKRNHPNKQWWWFDPRPYVDAVLTAVLDKGEPDDQ